MLQLIGLLALSWLIIRLYEKGDLSFLGLIPTKKRLKYATVLFLVSALIAASDFVLRMYITREEYRLSPSLTSGSVLTELWYQFRTVFTEELICRGIILYILIKKAGQRRAVILSAVFFGLLHWLNAGVWGNLNQMILVFTFTFAMGLLLAYAYARTFSLLIPLAIHLGWNLTQNYIFPGTAAGNHVFILSAPPPAVTISYFSFFILLFFPKLAVLAADYFIVKRHAQAAYP